jgi:flagellar basal-body rod protein FlgB
LDESGALEAESGCVQALGTIIAHRLSRQKKFVNRELEKTGLAKTSSIMELLQAGLKAEGLRQRAIASNIANLETPGYRRVDVDFEDLLAKALDSPGAVDVGAIEPQLHQPKQTPVKANGNDVSLEAEVGEMVKNTLRYKTFIRLLNRKYQQVELAMSTNPR